MSTVYIHIQVQLFDNIAQQSLLHMFFNSNYTPLHRFFGPHIFSNWMRFHSSVLPIDYLHIFIEMRQSIKSIYYFAFSLPR